MEILKLKNEKDHDFILRYNRKREVWIYTLCHKIYNAMYRTDSIWNSINSNTPSINWLSFIFHETIPGYSGVQIKRARINDVIARNPCSNMFSGGETSEPATVWHPRCGIKESPGRKAFASISREPGPWFNIKMLSYQYRKSHCGDKTVVRSSYLHNGISYTGKMTSLYWFGPLAAQYRIVRKCDS